MKGARAGLCSWVFALLACATAPQPAADPFGPLVHDLPAVAPPPNFDDAERQLVAVGAVETVSVRMGGVSQSAMAFQQLLQAPDAAARFHRLMESADLGGQLYALCGLYFVDSTAFAAHLGRLWRAHPDDSIQTISSDVMAPSPVRRILGADAPHPAEPSTRSLEDIAGGRPCSSWAGR
jgi:hypothetical protein